MTVLILDEAAEEVDSVQSNYELARAGLGDEYLIEFRRCINLILDHPDAWQALDDKYRRHRFHRFPYGIVYRVDTVVAEIVIVAVMHLAREPDYWRYRE